MSSNNGHDAGVCHGSAAVRRWSRIHVVTGVIVGVWLLLMALTGIAINHQEGLGLMDVEVPNAWLPAHYTDEFHPESTGLHVVIADLHSGRFVGSWGRYISDLIGLLLIVSVLTGFHAHRLRRRLKHRAPLEPVTGERWATAADLPALPNGPQPHSRRSAGAGVPGGSVRSGDSPG